MSLENKCNQFLMEYVYPLKNPNEARGLNLGAVEHYSLSALKEGWEPVAAKVHIFLVRQWLERFFENMIGFYENPQSDPVLKDRYEKYTQGQPEIKEAAKIIQLFAPTGRLLFMNNLMTLMPCGVIKPLIQDALEKVIRDKIKGSENINDFVKTLPAFFETIENNLGVLVDNEREKTKLFDDLYYQVAYEKLKLNDLSIVDQQCLEHMSINEMKFFLINPIPLGLDYTREKIRQLSVDQEMSALDKCRLLNCLEYVKAPSLGFKSLTNRITPMQNDEDAFEYLGFMEAFKMAKNECSVIWDQANNLLMISTNKTGPGKELIINIKEDSDNHKKYLMIGAKSMQLAKLKSNQGETVYTKSPLIDQFKIPLLRLEKIELNSDKLGGPERLDAARLEYFKDESLYHLGLDNYNAYMFEMNPSKRLKQLKSLLAPSLVLLSGLGLMEQLQEQKGLPTVNYLENLDVYQFFVLSALNRLTSIRTNTASPSAEMKITNLSEYHNDVFDRSVKKSWGLGTNKTQQEQESEWYETFKNQQSELQNQWQACVMTLKHVNQMPEDSPNKKKIRKKAL